MQQPFSSVRSGLALWTCGTALLLAQTAPGAVCTWTGGGGNTLWTNELNWAGGAAPQAGDTIWFDNNPDTASSLTQEFAHGTNLKYGALRVDAGDTLYLCGPKSASVTLTFTEGFQNAGSLRFCGMGNTQAHGRYFTVTNLLAEGSVLNAAGAVLQLDSYASYRRSTARYNITGSVVNNGEITVRNFSSEGGGKVFLALLGEGAVRFENNGTVALEGAGYLGGSSGKTGSDTWAVLFASHATTLLELAGTGRVTMESGLQSDKTSWALIGGCEKGTDFINGESHTIEGCGFIGSYFRQGSNGNTLWVHEFRHILNRGLIRAVRTPDVATLAFQRARYSQDLMTFTNDVTGRLIAAGGVDGGTEMLIGMDSTAAASQFCNLGLLEARAGSRIAFGSNTVARLEGTVRGGGTLAAPAGLTFGAASVEPGDSAAEDGTGESGVGVLSVAGAAVLTPETVLTLQFAGVGEPGEANDAVAVDGALTLDGTVRAEITGPFPTGTVFTILTFTPGMLTDEGLEAEPDADGIRPVIFADNEAGKVYAVFPARSTMMTVR